MSAPISQTQCNGYCLPLYLYGGIAALGIGANFFFDKRSTFGQRTWYALKSTLWATAFGVLIYLICLKCKLEWAYIALVIPSILFGLQMLFLLLQRPKPTQ